MSLPDFLSFITVLIQISSAGLIPRAELISARKRILPRQTPDSACTNTPATRSCWGNGFSIATNYDSTWPVTGRVVEHTLEITNTTMNLDGGRSRIIYAVNGQYPGPAIRASWGDTLRITVKNSLTANGTSIHWHGIRQYKTNHMDGTNGITECPLAPGAWLVHCHVACHVGLGLGAQFLEDQRRISAVVGEDGRGEVDRVCEGWREYYESAVYKQEDSGL